MERYYIGIDGGGSKTEGVLTDAGGTVLAQCSGGPSNPNDIGFFASAELLASLSETLMTDASVKREETCLFCGIAGALNDRETLKRAVYGRLDGIASLEVDSDVVDLLSGNLPTGAGACIVCGTGSACFLRLPVVDNCTLYRIGGWGWLLDSAGSGYTIGRDAIEAVLRAYDGRGLPTLLTHSLAVHFGAPVHKALTDIYCGERPIIAACAPVVFDVAAQGDGIADDILDRNSRALAEYIIAAWQRFSSVYPAEKMPVVLGGSVAICRHPAWTERIQAHLSSELAVTLTIADVPPVFGAIAEAIRRDLTVTELSAPHFTQLKQSFCDSYAARISLG